MKTWRTTSGTPEMTAYAGLDKSTTQILEVICDGSLANKLEGGQRKSALQGSSNCWWEKRFLVSLYRIALPA